MYAILASESRKGFSRGGSRAGEVRSKAKFGRGILETEIVMLLVS